MKVQLRDWIPLLIMVVLLGISVLGSLVTGLSGGVEIGMLLLLAVVQVLWIGIPFLARKVGDN